MPGKRSKPLSIGIVLGVILLIGGCTSAKEASDVSLPSTPGSEAKPAAPSTVEAPGDSYEIFRRTAQAIGHSFKPDGFELFNHHEADAVYYEFPRELAWGKRQRTVVAGDNNKPSQYEFFYIENGTKVAIALNVMYVPQKLDPDVVGFLAVPPQTAPLADGTELTIEANPFKTQLFSYGYAIFVVHVFGQTPNAEATFQDVSWANRDFTLALHQFLDGIK